MDTKGVGVATAFGPGGDRWAEFWNKANIARGQGRIAQSLSFYSQSTGASPPSCEPYFEAAELTLKLNRDLAGLERLNERHRQSFAISRERFPVSIPGAKIGPEGWEYGLDCLLQANLIAASRVDWQVLLAEALEQRGQLRQALHWRRRAAALDSRHLPNQIALGLLLESEAGLGAAAQHYESLGSQWRSNEQIALHLAHVYRALGRTEHANSILHDLENSLEHGRSSSDAGHRAPPGEPSAIARSEPESIVLRAARLLALALAAVKVGPERVPQSFAQDLLARGWDLVAADPQSGSARLALGYSALVVGDEAAAASHLQAASLLAHQGQSFATGDSALDGVVHDALHWARAILADPTLDRPNNGPLPPIDAIGIARVHARQMWKEGQTIGALAEYANALKPFHVTSIPLRYELSGDYKVVFHERKFYAVPRDVADFVIIGGAVYKLVGAVRHSERRLPPWVLAAGLRARRIERYLAERSAIVPWLGHPARRVWLRLSRSGTVQRLARRASRLIWARYLVHGVLVADRRRALLEMIGREGTRGNGPSAPQLEARTPSQKNVGRTKPPAAAGNGLNDVTRAKADPQVEVATMAMKEAD